MGTITTWIGATLGGRSPMSSPWVIMIPPTMCVLIPQDVCYTNCNSAFLYVDWVPNAQTKFWLRFWIVPAWRAQQSLIIATMV
jgi:hypothetical protein